MARDTVRFLNPPALPPARGYSQVVEVPAGSRMVHVAAPPASTLVEVRRLFRDGVLLEVEAVAVVRDR